MAKEGPEYFTTGDWAQHFVAEANHLGWPIELKHMTAIPPRWQEPLRYTHRGTEIIQLSPPERTGVFCALVMGILANFDLRGMGHYTESAETLYLFAHTLRRAAAEVSLLQDPHIFDVPVDQWLSPEYHRFVAQILWHSRPRVDLSDHIRLTASTPALAALGLPTGAAQPPEPPIGSCELSIVDRHGNWVQMMNTLQAGGIPGVVVDGVPMVGSHARASMASNLSDWFAGGGRMRSVVGSTLVLRAGQPWLALGTPGNVHVTVPQVLSSILDYGMDPYEAAVLPRFMPLREDYVLEMEARLPVTVAAGLARMGIQVKPMLSYDYNQGSYQMCWRDEQTGRLNSCTDPRRAGMAGGI